MPEIADKFKQRIKSGDIDIEKLSSMTSEQRVAFFQKIMGKESAKKTTALFEEKLLLKNQKQGLVNWAKQISGLKPEAKRTLVDRIMRMEKVLSPTEEKMFLEELASMKLGTHISIDEAKKITDLASKVKKLENFTDKTGRVNYGLARLDLSDYVNSLNPKKANLSTNILNMPRTAMATLDLSAPLNQGWGMLSRKQFYKATKDMFSYAKNPQAFRKLQAEIMTRPTYRLAKRAGLRLSDIGDNLAQREEVFMSNLLDKVPGVKASERAYTGFLNQLRMDVFDDLIQKATLAGEDVAIGSKAAEDIAKMVNNFTGGARSFLGEGATQVVSGSLFSPRKLTSSFNILNPVNYINPKISKTARKEALKNLLGSVGITAGVIKLADVVGGDDVEIEFNPISSDFGKIKIGNTRIDLSGGMSSYATFLARTRTQKTKSTETGITRKLNEGYGTDDWFDIAAEFTRKKLSPVASLIVDSFTGENAIGEKKTIPQSVIDRFKPMFLTSLYELLQDEDSGGVAAKSVASLLAMLGAGASTYSSAEDWAEKTTKEMIDFKDKVGDEEFKNANKKYNDIVVKKIDELRKLSDYKSKTDEEKRAVIKELKDKTKKDIFKQYGFKPKRAVPSKKK